MITTGTIGRKRAKRPGKPPLPIPAEDQAKLERMRQELAALGQTDPGYREAARALWTFQEEVYNRANRCIHCGQARRGRRLCRDCWSH